MSGSRPETQRILLRGLLPALLFLLGGCAYSFTSGLPGHIRTIAIPLFANETGEFGVAEEITDQLSTAFVRDGTLRVVTDENEASSVLHGTVRTYSEEAAGFSREERVERFNITIIVDVRFVDRVEEEVLWESSRLFGSATYENTGPDQRRTGLERAIGQVVQEVLNGVVAGW
ncbi:MAG: LptE family protein [bacterium]